jgi:hypothetical protein
MATDTKNETQIDWIPILIAGPQGDKEITQDDIDAIVSHSRVAADQKVPVVFGRPADKGPVLAQIEALQRKGNTLSAKLSNVDPRMEKLLRAGMLKKRVVQLQDHGTPAGPSLKRVGMVQRQYVRGAWNGGASTEEQLNALCKEAGTVEGEASFAERDRTPIGTHVVFSERAGDLQRSSATRIPVEENSQRLNELAEARAQERSIGFCEALGQIASEQPKLTVPAAQVSFHELPKTSARRAYDRNGEKLTALAKQRAEENSISFGEALGQVAAECPELTVPDIQFREVEVGR